MKFKRNGVGEAPTRPLPILRRNPATSNQGSFSKRAGRVVLSGVFERRERWSLTPTGWIALLLAVALMFGLVVWRVHPFLAVTDRVDSQLLVVEGWIPNYALEESLSEFKAKPYGLIFTVGCDILTGVNVEAGDDQATYAAKRLVWLGMNPKLVQPVPSPTQYRNRSYASAVALREWVEQHRLSVTSFNLVTVGAHARRSRLLFQKAFGGNVHIGVIAVQDREYDPDRWWRSSEGVKEVISEGAGYLYARLFFHPHASATETATIKRGGG